MMNKHLFSEGVSNIDVDAVERLLQIEKDLEKKRARRKFAWIKPVLIAASLALLLCAVLVIIPFIPKDLNLDYQSLPEGSDVAYDRGNAWIYYASADGEIEQEYVTLPLCEQNVFLSWKHLSGVDNAVQMMDCKIEADHSVSAQPVPQTLWEHLSQAFSQSAEQKTMTVTLSAQITSQPNYQALIESLQKTLAKYAGISPEQVRILIDGEQIGTTGTLQFSHNLQGGIDPIYVIAGKDLEITVTMTNISDEEIEYFGSLGAFVPDAMLTMGETVQDVQVIYHEPIAVTEEYARYVLAPGQSREITYTFKIPEQAAAGAYDLFVSFGDQSFTFEKAVNVIYSSMPAIGSLSSGYLDFLQEYGLHVTDPAAFKSAVQQLSYNGVGLFELMNEADVDWLPCYSGELYDSEHFRFVYSEFSPDGRNKSQTTIFEATVLPDGMTLPFGISTEKGLVDALTKLNMSEKDAKYALEKRRTMLLSDSVLSSDFTVTVSFDSAYTEIAYEDGPYIVLIRFDENGEAFKLLQVCTKNAPVAPGTRIFFTSFGHAEFEYEFSAQQCDQFLSVLERAEKIPDVVDLACDSAGIFNGFPFDYDSNSGTLIMNGVTYTLTERDREWIYLALKVGENGYYYFDPDATIEVDSPYDDVDHFATLSGADRDRIVAILNGGNWKDEEVEVPCNCSIIVTGSHPSSSEIIMRQELQYSPEAGIFLYDGHCLRLSDTDMNTVEEILAGYAVQLPED